MSSGRLVRLAEQLEAAGIDAGDLRVLQEELDVVQEPPGLLRRVTTRAMKTARTQWRNILGEVEESREMLAILGRRIATGEPMTDEARDKVRAQLFDLFRAVPAGLLVVGNAVQPIPGTSMLSPWLLSRLGLLPSRWREAHLLDQLHKMEDKLRSEGHGDAADRLHDIEEEIEHEADERELMAKRAALLTRWDANRNGVWDDDEREAYRAEIERLRTLAIVHGPRKRWFLLGAGQVFGPVRLSQFVDVDEALPLLVCFDGDSGWVELGALLDPNKEPLGWEQPLVP